MVRRSWIAFAVDLLFGAHDGSGEPRVGAGDELSEEFHVESCSISRGAVLSVVGEAHIVHVVGDEVRERLVVYFRGELEGAVLHAELVVHSAYYLDGAL